LEDTDDVAQKMTGIMLKDPLVKSVYASVGAGLAPTGPGGSGGAPGEVRRATVTANLIPKNERSDSQQDWERKMAEKFQAIPGARIRFGVDGSTPTLNIALTSDDG